MCNSSVWSDLVKLAYRGFAGFFVFIFLFTFGVMGLILSFAGALVTVLSWIPLAYPEILDLVSTIDSDSVVGVSVATSDPVLASLALLLAGLVLLGVGLFFLAFTYGIGKGAVFFIGEFPKVIKDVGIAKSVKVDEKNTKAVSIRESAIVFESTYIDKSR